MGFEKMGFGEKGILGKWVDGIWGKLDLGKVLFWEIWYIEKVLFWESVILGKWYFGKERFGAAWEVNEVSHCVGARKASR